jgi:hypothetical protein
MPYTIKPNENGEHCVHKKNPDGSVGKKIACHDTKDEAVAQIGAIESSESEKKSFAMANPMNIYINPLPTATTGQTSFGNTTNVVVDADTKEEEVEEMGEDIKSVDVEETEDVVEEEEATEEEINPNYAVKSLGQKRLGGYGILWGDERSRDLQREFFTPETKDLKSIFNAMGKIPLIVHHAADDTVKTFVYGEVDVMVNDEVGMWWEGKISEFEVYKKYVKPLLDRQAMFSSTGTLPAAKRVRKNGEITRWPVAEMTTTWTPAEWRMLERPVDEIKAAYKTIDLECDLSDYDEQPEQETEGAVKARLQALVQYHISELELLETEI